MPRVHPGLSIKEKEPNCWYVIHTQSGHRLHFSLDTQKKARKFARLCSPLLDWSQTKEQLEATVAGAYAGGQFIHKVRTLWVEAMSTFS